MKSNLQKSLYTVANFTFPPLQPEKRLDITIFLKIMSKLICVRKGVRSDIDVMHHIESYLWHSLQLKEVRFQRKPNNPFSSSTLVLRVADKRIVTV